MLPVKTQPWSQQSRRTLPNIHQTSQLSRRPMAIPETQADAPLFSKLSMPVYSLSTCSCSDHEGAATGSSGRQATMNLVTYAAPVSIKPRRFAIGLYVGTLSYDNFKQTRRGVLQILKKQHTELFHILGKTSGRNTDKVHLIKGAGFSVHQRYGLPTLADAACVMEVQAASDFIPCGDHEVVICDVIAYENAPSAQPADKEEPLAADADVLYTAHLRQLGYMQ